MNKKIVLDANIYVKLFKKEDDTGRARELVASILKDKTKMLAPSIVINETITTLEVNKVDIEQACDFFKALINSNLELTELNSSLISDTLDITREGHVKSGYPTFSDSMYHALAIQKNALFITADHRHYQKTRHLGNIELLKNYH